MTRPRCRAIRANGQPCDRAGNGIAIVGLRTTTLCRRCHDEYRRRGCVTVQWWVGGGRPNEHRTFERNGERVIL